MSYSSTPFGNKRWQIALVILVRSLFFTFALIGLNSIDPLGTPIPVLSLLTTIGVAAGSLLACSSLANRGFFFLCGIILAVFYLISFMANYLPFESAIEILAPYTLSLHFELSLLCLVTAASSTWMFWRFRDTPTVELFILLGSGVVALSGHRDFRLDNPLSLSSIAWQLGIDQIYMFTFIGISIIAIILLSLSLSGLSARQSLVERWQSYSLNRGRRSLPLSIGSALAMMLIFAISFSSVYNLYHKASLTRLGNGVGEGNQEGLSPLGFHSALGSTNQPAALVRLEGDYRENPFTPMLYLRESALSQYDGHEMVIANSRFDSDIPGNSPSEPFNGIEDADLTARVPIVHSVYLMAEHKLTMAIDYPLTIRPLKNPNPGKFKGSFRAYSVAPGFTKKMLSEASVGDPRWSAEVREHYLKTNQDSRYHALAEKVTSQLNSPLSQALALTAYLSKKSIYTLTPNHDVTKEADQTAPFLFGDLRGYCVHFAHAMVYMLRSLGIPARIGTGYLTDLSQSKDGHILLRMSDRHAWAEVYVTELGWIPFDIQPEQVENHADTQVDLKLLEELMGLIEPGEEILPKELSENEAALERPWNFSLPKISREAVIVGLVLILLLFILLKLYLRFGWMLHRSPRFRAYASYRALAGRLLDLGFARIPGETRSEFRTRMNSIFSADPLSSVEILTRINYQSPDRQSFKLGEIDEKRLADLAVFRRLSLSQKLRMLLSPRSLLRIITRGGW